MVSAYEKVPVSLSLFISDEDDTKSIGEDEIMNLWIIQFNGTSVKSKVLGEPIYIEDFKNFTGSVELVMTSEQSSICFIANTFEGPGQFRVNAQSTIDDIKNMRRVVSRETDVLGSDGNGGFHVMCNSWINVDCVSEGMSLSVPLKRNVAKVNVSFSITGKAADDNLVIKTVQFCSVPSLSYYFTDRVENEELVAPFPSMFDLTKVNYQTVQWDASSALSAYLPVNLRGVGPDGIEDKEKNKYAPDGSTYLLVSAAYGKNGENTAVYTLYLGANMSNDYNIKANNVYNYVFTISSPKGSANGDYRVSDWGTVDFTQTALANSYILNPTPVDGQWRHFKIPVKRANDFWGKNGYEDKTQYVLSNKSWCAYILAADFPITVDNFRIVEPTRASGDNYFEVAVKSGLSGNVIVAAGPDSQTVSWSWHLWITSYDPSNARTMGPGKTGQYIYPVTGGSVHRYKGDYWNNNPNVYIMDRYLGSFVSEVYPEGSTGFLYYQFGRKDPFFAPSNYKYPANVKPVRVSYEEANSEVSGVVYSVQNPLKYINAATDKGWTNGNDYSPSPYENIVWNDPKVKDNTKKSIFDPCPPGYCLPPSGVFSDFKYNTSSNPSTNVVEIPDGQSTAVDIPLVRGFKLISEVKGLQYWPNDGNDIPEHIIFFPATGYYEESKTTSELKLANNGVWINAWLNSPYSASNGRRLFARRGYVNGNATIARARAFPVRCITYNE